MVDGRLRRSYKDGQARFNGYLEDYACVADGLLALDDGRGVQQVEEQHLVLAGGDRADRLDGGPAELTEDRTLATWRPEGYRSGAVPRAVYAHAVLCEHAHTRPQLVRVHRRNHLEVDIALGGRNP